MVNDRQRATMNRLRILLVEDCPDCADSTRMLLDLWGCDVVTARDGPAAVKLAQEHQPDVVLLDIGLPGIDGWAVARRLREQVNGTRPLLVAVTGYGLEEDRQKSVDSGIDVHLLKPMNPPYLERLLNKWAAHLEYRRRT
jgi:CheY-like chemotaxis protein